MSDEQKWEVTVRPKKGDDDSGEWIFWVVGFFLLLMLIGSCGA